MIAEERFWSKVRKTDTCWLWIAGRTGYGTFKYRSKTVKAAHYAWFLYYGEAPKGCVLHTCDNKRCVRKEHLFIGTTQDNTADKVRKGRCACGEAVNTSKLTEEEVLEIRRQAVRGKPQATLAAEFGVSVQSIWNVVRRRSWKHV